MVCAFISEIWVYLDTDFSNISIRDDQIPESIVSGRTNRPVKYFMISNTVTVVRIVDMLPQY